MRWTNFILIQFLLIAVAGGIVYLHKEQLTLVKTPPASLAQWYKPDNERQVWLHNMFKLRREMQAVKLYAENKDATRLEKWMTRLSEHYLKIGEMVPEWKKKLDTGLIDDLQSHASNNRYQEIAHRLDDLNENCKSCHADYRAVTATMYRAPDFASIEDIGPTLTYREHMKNLIVQVNQIKIASGDGMPEVALSSLSELKDGMNTLGKTCTGCHEKDKKDYPGDEINSTIVSLEESLKTGTIKDQGRELGTLAVMACARCHATHRLPADARKLFTDRQGWRELIRH